MKGVDILIEIKLTKCTIYLTEKELQSLLLTNPELYKEALSRGKAFKRNKSINNRGF